MTRYGGPFKARPPRAITDESRNGGTDASKAKLAAAVASFERAGVEAPREPAELLPAESVDGMTHYRQRCRFSMRGQCTEPTTSEQDDDDSTTAQQALKLLNYSMFDGADAAAITNFSLASRRVNALMPHVLRELRRRPAIGAHDLRAVHFHAPRLETSEPVVTLVYGAKIDDEEAWRRDAIEARRAVREAISESIHLVGRCRGATLISERDTVIEALRVEGDYIELEFPEGSFSHPNARANERSVTWLRERLMLARRENDDRSLRLLELYCGAANHTVALAPVCYSATAVEIDSRLADAARRNLARNHVRNADIVVADAERFSAKLASRERKASSSSSLRRIQRDDDDPRDPASVEGPRFDVVLVDPPRRGLDAKTLALVAHYDHVLYVSCNPDALRGDCLALESTHRLLAFAALDAFPSTPHLECLAHFVRRSLVVPCQGEQPDDDDDDADGSRRSSNRHGWGVSEEGAENSGVRPPPLGAVDDCAIPCS